jgi:hypothetical protein
MWVQKEELPVASDRRIYLSWMTNVLSFGCQDTLSTAENDILTALDNAGIVPALVTMLEHESPFCVVAAAGALCCMEPIPGVGKVLLGESGAIAALVRALESPPPPCHSEEEAALLGRCAALACLCTCTCQNVLCLRPGVQHSWIGRYALQCSSHLG